MRRILTSLVVAAAALAPLVPGSSARAAETAAERAAREIADAQDRAAAANEAYLDAQWRLEELQEESDANVLRVGELEAQVAALQSRVEQVALNRFTGSSESLSPLLNGFSSPEEQMQMSAYMQVIWDTADSAFDDYDSLNRDLLAERRTLDHLREQTLQQQTAMAALRDRALAEAETLKKVEAQRLKDEATRKALAAEQARRAAAAAARNSSVAKAGLSGRSGPSSSGSWGGVGWVCPTGTARVGFGDTWGAPRSGGRQHKGTDMMAALGTPLLAVVDGTAQARSNTLGGLVVFFYGDDGVFYYYAHLDSYGQLGRVAKGTVIGYVGTTGNANTPHLHFEIHPNGVGSPINPYPTLRAAC